MTDDVGKAGCSGCEEASEEELLARLDEVIERYKDKPGALIPVLQLAQGIFGYLPEVALKRIARGMKKPYSEVAGVVGFYSFFSTVPRGRNLVRVCLGTACYVRGGMQVLDALKKKLGIDVGETTEDREFSLEVARCFGACGLAPVSRSTSRAPPGEARPDSEVLAQYAPEAEAVGAEKGAQLMADKINSPADLLAMASKAKEDVDLRSGGQEIRSPSTWAPAASPPAPGTWSRLHRRDRRREARQRDHPPVRLRRAVRDGADGDRAVRGRVRVSLRPSGEPRQSPRDRALAHLVEGKPVPEYLVKSA